MTPIDMLPIDEDSVDQIIRVTFAKSDNADGTLLNVLHVLTDTLRRGAAGNRFEELVALEITTEFCEIRLRYFTDIKRKRLGFSDISGYDDTLGMWFVRYLFACINKVRKIEQHPFHASDLSIFLEDPYPFDTDPDPT